MTKMTGEQILMRIFIGEMDTYGRQPLYKAIIDLLREEKLAGATVFKGIAGFGAHSVYHTDHILELSHDLPIVIEVVDAQEKIDSILPRLDEMVQEGLITMEKVKVIKYTYKGEKK
ncbi:MAG: DUF190 domain-containing protein [Deltaproteobacteria bacterium]|nr:DUF190 domain-containing protein [Deltaproteobacteria bacterium]